MPNVVLDEISFYYPAPYTQVFESVSLHLDTAWKTALVGRNGRGKTTLLGLLSQRLKPSRGRVVMPVIPRCFPQTPEHVEQPTRTVIRNSIAPFAVWEREIEHLLAQGDPESLVRYGELQERFERMGGYDIDARIDKEGAALGLSMELLERPFETLSGGERTRALIVGLFVMPGAYPLLDEPTNHLDRHGRELLADYLARQERGFVLVSHDRRFLDRCVDHVVSINRSDVRLNRGNFSTWKAQMDREQDHEQRRNARLERELRSMERAARNRRTWSHAKEAQKIGSGPVDRGFIGHRAAKQMKRALAVERRMEEALDEQRSLLNNVEKSHRLKLPEPDTKVSERLVSLEGITLEVGGRTLLNDLSLAIHQGERVALVGPNGCGKTSLLRTVVGELKPSAGTVRLASRIRWVRAHQIPRWQRGYLREHLRRAGLDEGLFRAIMGCLALVGEMFDRPLETFSQGERKKVELCRSLLEPAHLLIWDEPLNYVDIASREQIEALLLEHQPTLLCVEHDQAFIDAVATRVVELPQ